MPIGDCTTPEDERFAASVVAAARKVHSYLGAGLLESSYAACLAHELRLRGHDVVHEVGVPLEYEGLRLEVGYRIDLLVDSRIVVEVKAVETLLPVHTAQLLTYLKLMKLDLGLLINFNVPLIKDGIRRVVRFNK